jgi:anti-sigma B factor antagonist
MTGPVAGSDDLISWSPVSDDKFLPPPFRVDIAHDGDDARLSPVGELDMSTVPQLEAALEDATVPGRRVIVDLRGLEFMDSTGLTLLTRWSLAAERDGFSLALVPGNERIQRLFEITRLVTHFHFVAG